MEIKTVDARGMECPKPVIITRDAVEAGAAEIEVTVDNKVSFENVTRFLKNAGYTVQHPAGGDMKIHAVLADDKAVKTTTVNGVPITKGEDYAILILSEFIGAHSNGLGEVLMKSFLGTLPSLKPLPRAIALMNGGVKLALPESSCSETLRALSMEGVRILVCGTCTKHFDVTEQVVVGDISNMFEITEKIFGTGKPIVIG